MTQPEQEAREMLAACPNLDCGSDKIDVKTATFENGNRGPSIQGYAECYDCGVCGPKTCHYVGAPEDRCLAAAKAKAAEMWNAFAARPTAGIDRATLARAMNPALFDADPVVAHQAASPIIVEVAQRRAMTVAGEVLERLALPTAAKTGERGAVIEECARIAADRATLLSLRVDDLVRIRAAKRWILAIREAANHALNIERDIRALSQPLPDPRPLHQAHLPASQGPPGRPRLHADRGAYDAVAGWECGAVFGVCGVIYRRLVFMAIENHIQHAAAEIAIGLGHLDAAIVLWNPGMGLSPAQEKNDHSVLCWEKYRKMVAELREFVRDQGP